MNISSNRIIFFFEMFSMNKNSSFNERTLQCSWPMTNFHLDVDIGREKSHFWCVLFLPTDAQEDKNNFLMLPGLNFDTTNGCS